MAAVHTCTVPQPSRMNSAASRQPETPPMPEMGMPTSGSEAICCTRWSAMGLMAGPQYPPCEERPPTLRQRHEAALLLDALEVGVKELVGKLLKVEFLSQILAHGAEGAGLDGDLLVFLQAFEDVRRALVHDLQHGFDLLPKLVLSEVVLKCCEGLQADLGTGDGQVIGDSLDPGPVPAVFAEVCQAHRRSCFRVVPSRSTLKAGLEEGQVNSTEQKNATRERARKIDPHALGNRSEEHTRLNS